MAFPTYSDSDLVAAYAMDDGDISGTALVDRSGNGNTGTLVGSPTQVAGQINKALSFNGTSQYTTTNISLDLGLDASIAFWTKWVDVGTYGAVIGSYTGNVFFIIQYYNQWFIIWGEGAHFSADFGMSAGPWYHVVFVKTASAIDIYVNASLQQTIAITSASSPTVSSSQWFAACNGIGYLLNATLDDLRIYNRALTQQNVTDLYNWTGASGTNYSEAITDAVGIADSIIRGADYSRLQSDALGVTDAVGRVVSYARSKLDSVGIADAVGRVATYARSQTDGMGVTDSLARTAAYSRVEADTVGVTDAILRVAAYVRNESDSVSMADQLGRVVTFARTIADTVSISDAVVRVIAYARSIADREVMTDVLLDVFNPVVSAAMLLLVRRQRMLEN
jgi:hypothetical protein